MTIWEPASPDSDLDEFRATLRRFALEQLAPDYRRWQHESFPRERLLELGELGVFGMLSAPEMGGTRGGWRKLPRARDCCRGAVAGRL